MNYAARDLQVCSAHFIKKTQTKANQTKPKQARHIQRTPLFNQQKTNQAYLECSFIMNLMPEVTPPYQKSGI